MEINVQEIWATPSTLHLRLVVEGKQKKWIKFANVHVPMSVIPSEVAALIWLSAGLDKETIDRDDVPLF